jgi:hypothetical protein
MVLDGPGCKLIWREALQARVRSVLVEVMSPIGEQVAGMAERAERGLIKQIIAQPA